MKQLLNEKKKLEHQVSQLELALEASSERKEGGDSVLLRERVLRLSADIANLQRRREDELEEARRGERKKLVKMFVEPLDDLEQALGQSSDPTSPWHQGMLGVRRKMLDVLKRSGVTRRGVIGELFDPHLHEAVGVVTIEGKLGGEVVAVVQAGYSYDDTDSVVRPARVIVSKT